MKKIAITLGSVCFILVIAIFIQIKTVASITNEEGISLNDNSELRDEVLKWRQAYKDAYKQLEGAEERLENARTQASAASEIDNSVKDQIKKNSQLLGLTEVKGSGIIIKLDDNREVNAEDVIDISSYVVHDGDLLHIVNELFNAGADAISINGKRIVQTTAIMCDGNIIRINDEIVGVPIEIKAIGYPERLYYNVAVRQGGYLKLMERDGVVVDIEKAEKIEIIAECNIGLPVVPVQIDDIIQSGLPLLSQNIQHTVIAIQIVRFIRHNVIGQNRHAHHNRNKRDPHIFSWQNQKQQRIACNNDHKPCKCR